MKLTIFFSISFLLVFTQFTFSQNEFGAVGSYWQYSYAPHNGDGFGWTKLQIEKDTLINNEIHKVIRKTFYHKPIASLANQYSYLLGETLQIKNDSVYFGGNLILDFGMSITDSMYLEGLDVNIKLAIDSITTEEIAGHTYKKWYGQKLCLTDPDNPNPYEPFIILEGVGQVFQEFLFWNQDNCIIGGGHNYFSCYKNGDFIYPPTAECEPLMLTSIERVEKNSTVKIFPNPTQDILNIESENSKILEIHIFNLEGKEVYRGELEDYSANILISSFEKGIYIIKIMTEKKLMMDRFLKID